eukprot:4948216-Heterocapsa_arctica.AAC.1
MVDTPRLLRADYVTERRLTTCDGHRTPALTGVPVWDRRSPGKSVLSSGDPVDPTLMKRGNGRRTGNPIRS